MLAATVASERLRIVATLIRRWGDWELAEDAFQEAVTRALTAWPDRGIPANPGAWLTTVAARTAVDTYRRSSTERAVREKVAVEMELEEQERRTEGSDPGGSDEETAIIDDDRLRLIFTCCHPALTMESRVALTLRTVVGLEVDEIARAFLVSEPTMQKRLVRARARIRDERIGYRVPGETELPERTAAVLAVLYLLFTEGYAGTTDLIREQLVAEAIRLCRVVSTLMAGTPQSAEVSSLLALMLFQHARTAERLDDHGDIVLLEDQDRGRWNRDMIEEALDAMTQAAVARSRFRTDRGPYALQAEIAREHATAMSFDSTAFDRIAQLYAQLAASAPSPFVEVQRAIAVAMSEGPDAGLALLDALEDRRLEQSHLLSAARADLLRRAGRAADALPHYRRALELAPTDAERRLLSRRVDEMSRHRG